MDKKELLDRIHNLKTLGSIKNIKQVLLGLLNLGDKEEAHNLQEITDKGSVTTNDIIVIDEINGAVTTISSGGVIIGGEDGKTHGINSNPLGTVVSYGEGGDSNYLIIEKDKAVFSKTVQGVDAVDDLDYVTFQQAKGLAPDVSGLVTKTELTNNLDLKANKLDVEGDLLLITDEVSDVKLEVSTKIDEAPEDGKTYGRKDALWQEVVIDTPTLQEVLNKGNTATGAIEAEEGVFNKIILGQWEISVDVDGNLITTAIP